MRPVLKAGLRAVWRDRDTLQIGVDPRRAVALSGMSDAGRVISLLDGSRDWAGVVAAARDAGISVKTVQRVLGLLAGAGALSDLPLATLNALTPVARGRIGTELATASLTYGDSDGGARTLARRRLAFVRVHGAGRIGAAVAGLLAAAGVGQVVCRDGGLAGPQDLSPAGLGLADLDLPRADGVVRVISRIAPDVQTADLGERPDLAVLTEPGLRRGRGADPGRDRAPGRGRRGGGGRGRAAGPAGPVGLPALPGPGPVRAGSGLAADPGPAGRVRGRRPGRPAGRRLRHRAGGDGGGPGHRAGPRLSGYRAAGAGGQRRGAGAGRARLAVAAPVLAAAPPLPLRRRAHRANRQVNRGLAGGFSTVGMTENWEGER